MRISHWFVSLLMVGCIALVGCDKNSTGEKKAPETLRISTHGGAFLTSQEEAFFKPFETMTGIKVIVDVQEASLYDNLKAEVESGNVKWDVVFSAAPAILRADRDGLLAPLDYTIINKKNLLPWASKPNAVSSLVYSMILAYNIAAFPKSENRPTSWWDFFDVEHFPGPRALREGPVGNLEIALLADGVDPKKLYPLDVERALRKLDTIKPYVKHWWKNGSEPPQWLIDGDVVLSSAYNGRIWAAQQNNTSLIIVWNQGLLDSAWWAVPKGLPEDRMKRAMEFIAFASRAEPQANQAKIITYGPTNIYAITKVPENMQVNLPTEEANLKKQVHIDNEWWLKNNQPVLKRWNEWKGK